MMDFPLRELRTILGSYDPAEVRQALLVVGHYAGLQVLAQALPEPAENDAIAEEMDAGSRRMLWEKVLQAHQAKTTNGTGWVTPWWLVRALCQQMRKEMADGAEPDPRPPCPACRGTGLEPAVSKSGGWIACTVCGGTGIKTEEDQ